MHAPPPCRMVVEQDSSTEDEQALLAEMQHLQSMLQHLQFERQHLSEALTERLEVECNRARSMTRLLQQGKRSSGHDESQPSRKIRGEGNGPLEPDSPLNYRSSDLGFNSAAMGNAPSSYEIVTEDEIDGIDEWDHGTSPDDGLDHGPPTYRSCSGDVLPDDVDEYDHLCDVAETARGLLDPTVDPAQVDLEQLRRLVATLSTMVQQGAALQEQELTAVLSQLGQLSMLPA